MRVFGFWTDYESLRRGTSSPGSSGLGGAGLAGLWEAGHDSSIIMSPSMSSISWRNFSPTSRVSVLIASIFLGCANPRGDDAIVALFVVVFPGILFLVVAVVPGRIVTNAASGIVPPPAPGQSAVSPYKRIWALLMSAGGFLGINGVQRFYVGKIGTGIISQH